MYETTFIVNASLDDQQIEATIAKVVDTIEKNGGQIDALERMGRKRLAYAINKKNNGFYVSIEFLGHGGLIGQLERFIQLDENIIRHLTAVVDKKALESRRFSAAQVQSEKDQVGATQGSETEKKSS